MNFNINEIAWEKINHLIPAIIQDQHSLAVLMLGYMNKEALEKTLSTKYITFYSRSKNRLWVKGETSGHFLKLVDIFLDCDQDTLLIKAQPTGPVCHTGNKNCFAISESSDWHFIQTLENIIKQREESGSDSSYTAQLLKAGKSRIAQKVGEEGVEVALAAIEKDDQAFSAEVADLFYHLLVLLRIRKLGITDVIRTLKNRNNNLQK